MNEVFSVTADDVASLDDSALREIVAKLCEAEAAAITGTSAGVTWGGSQDASDGGVDVRVRLPVAVPPGGFFPASSVIFQVKRPNQTQASVRKEMCPGGQLRPVIAALATEQGSYVIVSSGSSLTDSMLAARLTAMRESVMGQSIAVGFYDRNRVATWAARFPPVAMLIKSRLGRELSGWRPFGPWSDPGGSSSAHYELGEEPRIQFDDYSVSTVEGIRRVRQILRRSQGCVRLVGLSGVGKTRFAEALFDPETATEPLAEVEAVYCDEADQPNPSPTILAAQLVERGVRAVLVIDNCSADLHGRLAKQISALGSRLSLLTVEYDIRDDVPEHTSVVRMEAPSPKVAERLLHRKFPELSNHNVETIAKFSEGNARIAYVLAGQIDQSESLSHLSDEALFQRIFRQRHPEGENLLQAAEVFSVVYSFEGETVSPDSELSVLADLADLSVAELRRKMVELRRRGLLQARGRWRAVLPQAIADRLARRALESIGAVQIDRFFSQAGRERLQQSLARRLSVLHDSQEAKEIVGRWLEPSGMLGGSLPENDRAALMLSLAAPVAPEPTLNLLERHRHDKKLASYRVVRILRQLAYDGSMFRRAAILLAHAASLVQRRANDGTDAHAAFTSLFPILLSHTQAPIEERLWVVQHLMRTGSDLEQELAINAIGEMLKASSFTSSHSADFGARPRDFGYRPRCEADQLHWFASVLASIRDLAVNERFTQRLQTLVADHFREQWSLLAPIALEDLCRDWASFQHWPDGWLAVREALYFDVPSKDPERDERLAALERSMRPASLSDRIRVILSGRNALGADPEHPPNHETDESGLQWIGGYEATKKAAFELGKCLATDTTALVETLPAIISSDALSVQDLGEGLGVTAADPYGMWHILLEALPSEKPSLGLVRGFLAGIAKRGDSIAATMLDEAAEAPRLRNALPWLQSAIPLNSRGVARMLLSLSAGEAPIFQYQALRPWSGESLSPRERERLLSAIAAVKGGWPVAAQVVSFQLREDGVATAEVRNLGLQLLDKIEFGEWGVGCAHAVVLLVRKCLEGASRDRVLHIARQVFSAVESRAASVHEQVKVVCELVRLDAEAVLDEFLHALGKPNGWLWQLLSESEWVVIAKYLPIDTLIRWCAAGSAERMALASRIVPFRDSSAGADDPIWSTEVIALLRTAPDPGKLLKLITERFAPMSWSGSRSVLIESNGKLLDALPEDISVNVRSSLPQIRQDVADWIRQEQAREATERIADEGFE